MRPSSATIGILLLGISVAIYGVAAIWASASRRHWSIRAGVIAAILLVVLLLPAHELFVTYAWLEIVVLLGVATWRWRDSSRKADSSRRQLSLTSIFLLTLFIAVLCAIAPGFSSLTVRAWVDHSRDGVIAGGLCLLAVWLVYSRRSWFFRLSCGLVWLLVLATAQAGFWYAVHFSDPMLVDRERSLAAFWWPYWTRWMSFALAGLWLIVGLGHGAGWLRLDPNEPRRSAAVERLSKIAFVLVGALASALPLLVFVNMLSAPRIPAASPPTPNAYYQLADIGQLVSIPAGANLASADHATLRRLAIHWQHALPHLSAALSADGLVPVNYQQDVGPERWEDTQTLLTALLGEIRLAVFEFNSSRAANALINLVAVEELLGRGVTYQEFDEKWACLRVVEFPRLLNVLTAEDARRVARTLAELDPHTESLGDIERRQAARETHGRGWRGRAWHVMDQLSGEGDTRAKQFAFRYHLRRAVVRSWTVAAAIRAYWLERGTLPAELAALVPAYLDRVPANPFESSPEIEYLPVGETAFTLSCTPAWAPTAGLPMTPLAFRFAFTSSK